MPAASEVAVTGSLQKPNRTNQVIRELELLRVNLEEKHSAAPARPTPFIKSTAADVLLSALIVANALFIGYDIENNSGFDWRLWVVQSGFTLIFLLELILRVNAERPHWMRFFDLHGAIDLSCTVLGILDTWVIIPIYASSSDGGSRGLSYFSVIRLGRLFRLVRMINAFRKFGNLLMLVHTIRNSVKAVFWMSLLLGMLLYMGSVFTLLLLGIPLREEDEEVDFYYGSLGRALFSHFSAVTLERWPKVALAAMRHSQAWSAYWSLFITFGNCVLVNVMVGIIVEQVLKVTVEKDRRRANFEAAAETLRDTMQTLFDAYDFDASGELEKEEFRNLLENHHMRQIMRVFGVNMNVPTDMLHQIMDLRGEGAITFEDFFCAFVRLTGSTENLQMVFVQHEISACHKELMLEVEMLAGEVEAAAASGEESAEEPPASLSPLEKEVSDLRERLLRFAERQALLERELQAAKLRILGEDPRLAPAVPRAATASTARSQWTRARSADVPSSHCLSARSNERRASKRSSSMGPECFKSFKSTTSPFHMASDLRDRLLQPDRGKSAGKTARRSLEMEYAQMKVDRALQGSRPPRPSPARAPTA